MIQRSVGAVYVPSFQTTSLMVPSIGGDNFRVIPRNRVICFVRVLRQSRIILHLVLHLILHLVAENLYLNVITNWYFVRTEELSNKIIIHLLI